MAIRMRNSALMTGCCLATSATLAWSHQPLLTDDSGTQGAGGNQLELVVESSRVAQAGISSLTRMLPVTFTRGLSDTLDVFASVSHISISSGIPAADARGSGNPVLGLKWRFLESDASKISIAVKPQLLLPTNSANETSGLGSGRTSFGIAAILTRETSFGAVHANLFTSSTRYRDPKTNPDAGLVQMSVASVWYLGEAWKLTLDAGARMLRTRGAQARGDYVQIGAVYSLGKDHDFALGIMRNNDRAASVAASHVLTSGITWRFI